MSRPPIQSLLKRGSHTDDHDRALLVGLFHLGVLDYEQARALAYAGLHERAVYRRLRRLQADGLIRADRISLNAHGGATALHQLTQEGAEIARQAQTTEGWQRPVMVAWRGSGAWRRDHHQMVVAVYTDITHRLCIGESPRLRWAWPSERRGLVAGEDEARVRIEPDLLLLAWSDDAARCEATCLECDTGAMPHAMIADKLTRYRRLCAAARNAQPGSPLAWMDQDTCGLIIICKSDARAERLRAIAETIGLRDTDGDEIVDVVASPHAAADLLAEEYLPSPSRPRPAVAPASRSVERAVIGGAPTPTHDTSGGPDKAPAAR